MKNSLILLISIFCINFSSAQTEANQNPAINIPGNIESELEQVSKVIERIVQLPESDLGKILSKKKLGEVVSENLIKKEQLSGAMRVLGIFSKFMEATKDAVSLYKKTPSLHNSDCVPNLEVNPSEVVPSSCGDNADCKDCYLKAYKEINFLRRQLARYNCYVNNVKKFADASITFGDKWSGVHPMAGIAWVSQKAGINKELDNLKGTIKKKNGIWLENLKKALMQVHECEAQNGQPDWYQRYGNLFFELIKEKYTRID
jgi:hypothetical protein